MAQLLVSEDLRRSYMALVQLSVYLYRSCVTRAAFKTLLAVDGNEEQKPCENSGRYQPRPGCSFEFASQAVGSNAIDLLHSPPPVDHRGVPISTNTRPAVGSFQPFALLSFDFNLLASSGSFSSHLVFTRSA